MDKLTMAHEYAMALVASPDYGDGMSLSDFVKHVWKYADAMQAEADKRLNADVGATDASEWQPDWSQAPENAEYWAMDGCGLCNWYARKPEISGNHWDFGRVIEHSYTGYDYKGNWKDSLRKRPEGK